MSWRHGTVYAYRTKTCRCSECSEFMSQYRKRYEGSSRRWKTNNRHRTREYDRLRRSGISVGKGIQTIPYYLFGGEL